MCNIGGSNTAYHGSGKFLVARDRLEHEPRPGGRRAGLTWEAVFGLRSPSSREQDDDEISSDQPRRPRCRYHRRGVGTWRRGKGGGLTVPIPVDPGDLS